MYVECAEGLLSLADGEEFDHFRERTDAGFSVIFHTFILLYDKKYF